MLMQGIQTVFGLFICASLRPTVLVVFGLARRWWGSSVLASSRAARIIGRIYCVMVTGVPKPVETWVESDVQRKADQLCLQQND